MKEERGAALRQRRPSCCHLLIFEYSLQVHFDLGVRYRFVRLGQVVATLSSSCVHNVWQILDWSSCLMTLRRQQSDRRRRCTVIMAVRLHDIRLHLIDILNINESVVY